MAISSRAGAGELPILLRRSAAGDSDAFARFYDLTCERVLRYELARAHTRGGRIERTRRAAEEATRARYLAAWASAAEHAASGRSPLAWLLALPVGRAGTPASVLPGRVAVAG